MSLSTVENRTGFIKGTVRQTNKRLNKEPPPVTKSYNQVLINILFTLNGLIIMRHVSILSW